MVALAYMLTQVALARVLNIVAGRTGSILCACPVQLKTSTTDCPAYHHIRQQYSNLFHQASSSSVAAFQTLLCRKTIHTDQAGETCSMTACGCKIAYKRVCNKLVASLHEVK